MGGANVGVPSARRNETMVPSAFGYEPTVRATYTLPPAMAGGVNGPSPPFPRPVPGSAIDRCHDTASTAPSIADRIGGASEIAPGAATVSSLPAEFTGSSTLSRVVGSGDRHSQRGVKFAGFNVTATCPVRAGDPCSTVQSAAPGRAASAFRFVCGYAVTVYGSRVTPRYMRLHVAPRQ